MTKYFVLVALILSCGLIHSQKLPKLYENVDREKMEAWVDSVFDSMTLDERIGQLFMIVTDPGTDSKTTDRILQYIENQKIGGILFSGGALNDQAISTNLYQKACKIPLLISFDGEWGLSMRLSETPRFPKNILLGAITDNYLIYNYGKEVGRECRKLGVHINFAPVLDVNNNPANPVIGTRSFGENPQKVAEKGIAYAKGLESVGIMAVGKHFPGHGDTSDDSHKTLPLITHERERLDEIELYPFRQFINSGFSGIMTGHLSIPAFDKTFSPTSLSSVVVGKLLKDELGFEGLAFTDALDMKGAGSGSICVKALLAGNDILLKPTNLVAEFGFVKKAIEDGTLDIELIEEKCLKILRYKYIAGLNNYAPIDSAHLYSENNSQY
jgi:beta-glucosidase-like glycosyl hydrolase